MIHTTLHLTLRITSSYVPVRSSHIIRPIVTKAQYMYNSFYCYTNESPDDKKSRMNEFLTSLTNKLEKNHSNQSCLSNIHKYQDEVFKLLHYYKDNNKMSYEELVELQHKI